MADIVERLREVAERADANYPAIMEKAADEIEKLRAALEEIAGISVSSWIGDIHGDAQDEWRDKLDAAISIARAALQQEVK